MGATQSCSGCGDLNIDPKLRNKFCCENASQEENSQNQKPLKPILFSDLGSANGEQSPEHTKDNPLQFAKEQMEESFKPSFEQELADVNQNKDGNQDGQLVVVNFNEDEHSIYGAQQYKPISVPFSVIKLTINEPIAKQISSVQRSFFKVHSNPKEQFFNTWKLQPGGYYSNFVKDGNYILISDKYFYEGNCLTQSNKFNLTGEGLLINNQGTYKGKFKNSQANGKGSYLTLKDKKLCEGLWKDGIMTQGVIQTRQYKFEGSIKNGKPDGNGKLNLKLAKITYEGKFKGGKFYDQDGTYVCPQYKYKGGFKEGKKMGFGVFEQRQSQNPRKSKMRSLLKVSGIWENDSLIEEKVMD